MTAAEGVLGPQREALSDLRLLRASIGSAAFNAEKQNDPVDPALGEWPEAYFTHAAFWLEQWPQELALKRWL
jgi:hypothetical protein